MREANFILRVVLRVPYRGARGALPATAVPAYGSLAKFLSRNRSPLGMTYFVLGQNSLERAFPRESRVG